MMTTVFMHADGADISLMTLGFIGAVFDGVSFPISVIITGKLMNIIGGADASDDHNFMHNINEVRGRLELNAHLGGADFHYSLH